MNILPRAIVTLLAGLLLATTGRAEIIHVDTTADGADDGSSWEDAFNDLQDALAAAAAGDALWVAAGEYFPTANSGTRGASFHLLDEVSILGGFPEGGGTEEERDWQTHVTVLSGDIDDDDVTDDNGVVIDADDIAGANSFHVVTASDTDETAVLDGFFITAGLANGGGGGSNGLGGGLYNQSGDPTLTRLHFSGNRAHLGGGMVNRTGGSPTLIDTRFSGNRGGQNGGGGMYNLGDASPTLINVSFRSNRAQTGGGMRNTQNSNPILINVHFSGNQAGAGGGMYNLGSSPALINVSFSGNQANSFGGGVFNEISSDPTLINTIFWNNQADGATDTFSASMASISGSTPAIAWSLVANCNPGGEWVDNCGTDGGDNLPDADPLFIETPDPADAPTRDGDLRLRVDSPAVDAGDPATDPVLFPENENGDPLDLDRDLRFAGDAIDLGPYEFQPPELTFDPAALDFGEIPIGQVSAPEVVTLQNTGAAATDVDYPVNGPFEADTDDCGPSLPADSSCQISVVFAPTDTGEVLGSLEASDPGGVRAELELTGTGVLDPGVLDLAPPALDFGDVAVGATHSETVTVGNLADEGAADLELTAIGVGGADAFEITGGDCMVGTLLVAGDSCVVEIRFAPTTVGALAGVLTVETGDGQQGQTSLSGNGLGELTPAGLEVDPAGLTPEANGVLEPGEAVEVAPAWRNDDDDAQSVGGTAADFAGPDGATYSIDLDAADYGLIQPGETASCLDTEVCYRLALGDPAVRPATHWEATFDETLDDSDGTEKTWTLHIGDSFTDVPATNLFYSAIETLLHSGVTSGCTPSEISEDGGAFGRDGARPLQGGAAYCPGGANSRSQMPVFMLRALMGPDYTPLPCVEGDEPFDDVPFNSTFCPWIQDLADRDIVSGCGDDNYCPSAPVTRAQMAIFLLKTLEGAGYEPPACASRFTDVPCPSLFADWIEDLAERSITGGCSANEYCPGDDVTRAQMAVFIAKTFGLTLYGP